MDFYGIEQKDAVRLSWNNFPSNRLALTRSVIPMGALYSPMKDIEDLMLVAYSPLYCKCNAVINPYNPVDFRNKLWTCVFCSARNPFPREYAEHISETKLPPELNPNCTTMEYILAQQQTTPASFIYVIDTCIPQEELNAIRDAIQQSLQSIPADTLIGLITFGRTVFTHELGYQECPKCYSFKGSKDYTQQQILEMLQVATKQEIIKRFLVPISECEFAFNSILDDLQCDPWPVPGGEREVRASGSALKIASTIAESATQYSKILFFIGGPCTSGPGQVVGLRLEETIRSYLDIQKENPNIQHMQKAKAFYTEIAKKAIKSNLTVDIFAFTLDQFGLLEMKYLAEKTGGVVVMQEKFDSDMFRDSYKKLFDKDANGFLKMGFGSKMDVFVTKDIKLQGAIGPCISLKKAGPMVSEMQVGESGTTSWYTGGLDRNSTILFLLDLAQSKDTSSTPNAFIQFITLYRHSSRVQRLRVTTIMRRFADPNNQTDLAKGFDQEAACVLMARLGIQKTEQEESIEVLKWLDRSLIRLVAKFGSYKKDDASSFRLGGEFQLYPQFMYHLRRSHFITTFGASPDETTFYRASLSRENVTNALVMIQPALLQYTCDDPQPQPVILDIESLKPDVVLLLDTYFNVVVYNGEQVQQWKDEGYDQMPEYGHIKELLDAPYEDVKLIMEDRFPVPRLIKTYYGHGNERYIKSRVNPSVNTVQNQNVESGNYITDDASLKVFTDHLIRLAVQTYDMTKELLGQGAFGSVFLAIRKTDGLKVAVKVCNSAYIAKEISILVSLKSQKHSNVVGIIDLFEQGNILLIVLEYCNKGTLYDMLATRELIFDPMREPKIVNIITQIALGLQFLHLNNISHRDIKPENILRTIQNQIEMFKITDFGLSAKEERMTTQKVGTAYYLAPEILNGQAYDKKVDIWALGLLLDELLHGTPFYNGKNDEEVFNKIRTQQFEIRDDQYRNASVFDRQKQAIRTVLMKTIQRDPVMRADLSWVIQQLQEYSIQSPVETGFQGYKFEQPQIDQQFQLPIDLRFCTIHNITYDKNCIKCSDEVYKQKAYLELAKIKLDDFFQSAIQDALLNIDSKLQPTDLFHIEFRSIYAQFLTLIKNDFALYLADLQSSIKQPWIDDALNSSQPDNKIVNFVWYWLQVKKDTLRVELQTYVEVQINTLCKEIRAKLHI